MKDFILRNKQIFITGLVIGGIFLIIIALSPSKRGGGPKLAPVETSPAGQNESKIGENPGVNYAPKGLWNAPPQEAMPEEENPENAQNLNLETPTEILEINYNGEGFFPFTANGLMNQTVRWTNQSEKSIFIKQIKSFFPEFAEPVEIAPGASLEFKLTKIGMWSYEDTESEHLGSIFITLVKP